MAACEGMPDIPLLPMRCFMPLAEPCCHYLRSCSSRYLLRGVVMGYLTARWPKWALVDAALSNEGWKLITLLRLSPVVPWNVLNYALSVTGEYSHPL